MDVTVRGADDLARVAKRLRETGDKELKRELYRGLQRATKPLKANAQKAAGAQLPQSGGLAAIVARSRLTTKVLTGKNPAVKIVAKGTAVTTDKGFVRHPVFGGAWVTQKVQGGWFSETLADGADEVRAELIEAMNDVAKSIDGGI
jgi:uncharacterized protein YbjQ (UPF0145 family)